MENKTVTKKVLAKEGIKVPVGEEFNSIEEAKLFINNYIGKPIVIKPKSTNFGTGINYSEVADADRRYGRGF